MSERRLGFLVALGVVALDQVTKIWAVAALSDGPIDIIGSTFRFALTRNPGAAFSSFQSAGPLLAVVALVMATIIHRALPQAHHRTEVVALGLVMGGAVGNLADRVFRADGLLDGAVVDFIDFSFFPSFNVADSAITIGVAMLVILTMFVGRSRAGE